MPEFGRRRGDGWFSGVPADGVAGDLTIHAFFVYSFIMDKARRHRVMLKLLKNGPAPSQERLREMLAEAGIEATQATISRDMRELGIVKVHGGYTLAETLADSLNPAVDRSLEFSISTFLVSADIAGTMVVLKTGPGHAQALAAELDRAGVQRVVGSIAGDDTIFLATRSTRDARSVLRDLERLSGQVPAAAEARS